LKLPVYPLIYPLTLQGSVVPVPKIAHKYFIAFQGRHLHFYHQPWESRSHPESAVGASSALTVVLSDGQTPLM
jgi:hypothetical protein